MSGLFDLTGKVALVTGANTGLGQAIAVGLAQAGADIVAVGRSAPDETRKMVVDAGRKLTAITADLGSTEPIARVVADAGPIEILVNNAGIIRRADSTEFTEADWDAVMDTNLKVAFFLSQAFAKGWIAAGRGGKIIQVASMLSFQGGVRVPSYTASKSGLAGLTKALANEWAGKGVNVNAIAPGYFTTNNTEALRADETRSRQILARIPAGRWGLPEDLAGVAVFLASRASDYMHGAVVPVDGGWLAR
ncbi:2-dehydro-3-deoxy-D-gluconate 5-dehydrogenase KduD [Phenylobacterium sp.]|jgi:2-deoxy-D-gluconate 3-dehydrogenase|uniref:2-dehydro-3-deoxy-D-gluconate 5-dehydrogenase KduD n=1 Tax=Phenylobacterium sp. TaxID=1871053 RepID=UPI002F3FFC51